ncbi:hypothetical protein PR202_gb15368 [Eleusine coracana subsp. coracana]|uniref:Uncharacterized protein n=1 Tax=Eleusine coracana subsp. coracana TaxID=191504 RepID=A0AAV5EXM0_ELECO|nr:hypothetical protein QOZ80_4BG0345660 [Eleusine coracana subsp. coracana]GJN27351.1 hypothetical protein PR202_gb15368 [Eleusine coracana subsp. coracana]
MSDAAAKGMVVDFKGNPADKSRTGGSRAAVLIAVTELAERVCVMGISMNLVTYLIGDLHLSSARSANIVTNFMGTLNLLALLGGFVADARLGRYLTIAVSTVITVLGMTLLAASTALPGMRPPPCADGNGVCVSASGGQLAMLFAALYTVAVGAGGIKANVSGLGTDQFDTRDPAEEPAADRFFNRFFFCISIGSAAATTALVYVQDRVGRGWGYGAPAGVMVAAAAAFVAGTPRYRYRGPEGSPLTVVGRVLWAAWRNRGMACPVDPSELHGFHAAKVTHTDRLRCLDRAAIVDANLASDKAVSFPTLTDVEDVKMLTKLLPIWSTCLMFWTVYCQMTTFSVQQATRMNRHLGSTFLVPPGSLSAVLFLTILLFTSLNDHLLVPLARRATGNPQGLTALQRVGAGLAFAVAAMAAAALVEAKRRGAAVDESVVVSAFWLVPQLVLVGAGEAFAYVGQLQFFIREAPERMKSLCTGLCLATVAMGFFLSSALVDASPDAWVRDDLDKGRLDLFYWMLAVLGVIDFVVFLLFSSRHQYKVTANDSAVTAGTENEEQTGEEDAMKISVAVNMMDV